LTIAVISRKVVEMKIGAP